MGQSQLRKGRGKSRPQACGWFDHLLCRCPSLMRHPAWSAPRCHMRCCLTCQGVQGSMGAFGSDDKGSSEPRHDPKGEERGPPQPKLDGPRYLKEDDEDNITFDTPDEEIFRSVNANCRTSCARQVRIRAKPWDLSDKSAAKLDVSCEYVAIFLSCSQGNTRVRTMSDISSTIQTTP